MRPRGDGRPQQGATVGFVRRPHQLPPLVSESVSPVAVELRLRAAVSALIESRLLPECAIPPVRRQKGGQGRGGRSRPNHGPSYPPGGRQWAGPGGTRPGLVEEGKPIAEEGRPIGLRVRQVGFLDEPPAQLDLSIVPGWRCAYSDFAKCPQMSAFVGLPIVAVDQTLAWNNLVTPLIFSERTVRSSRLFGWHERQVEVPRLALQAHGFPARQRSESAARTPEGFGPRQRNRRERRTAISCERWRGRNHAVRRQSSSRECEFIR